ncbi:MAG: hypothetical protein RMJ46_07210, partial [Bacteroidota bacterium]|nr:hypothetical protein [Bacteroidota bacterium]
MQRFVELDRMAADVIIEPELGWHGTLEFHSFDELVDRGREAAERAVPLLRAWYRRLWDSLAGLYTAHFAPGYAPVVVELSVTGFAAGEEQELRRVRGLPLPQVLAHLIRLSAGGAYRRLHCRALWNGSGIVLTCRAEPYPRYNRVDIWGIPYHVAEPVARLLTARAGVSASPAGWKQLEWLLLSRLSQAGYGFVAPVGWSEADSCLQIWLRSELLQHVRCTGLSTDQCRELQSLLSLREGEPVEWERLGQRWRQLQHSGLFRTLEARLWQGQAGLGLHLFVQREPTQRLHIGVRSDNERYTRLWLEAIHREGMSRQIEVRFSAGIGPRDALAAAQFSLQRAFPEVWAALRLRAYASQQLV